MRILNYNFVSQLTTTSRIVLSLTVWLHFRSISGPGVVQTI